MRNCPRRFIFIPVLATALGLLLTPRLSAAMVGNAGMLAFLSGVIRTDRKVAVDSALTGHPSFRWEEEHQVSVPLSLFERAVQVDPTSALHKWHLSRIRLMKGDESDAISLLDTVPLNDIRSNPFLYQDFLLMLSKSGHSDQVVALHNAAPTAIGSPLTKEVVALALLESESNSSLHLVEALIPNDLYVNYTLSEITGDRSRALQLKFFPLSAISPQDDRLIPYLARAIPGLIESGWWPRTMALNVMSYLVWQRSGSEGVRKAIRHLVDTYPQEPEWRYFLAELHHRRAELVVAEQLYRKVLAIDPEHSQAQLGLAEISETLATQQRSSDAVRKMLDYYRLYHALNPDDLLTITRLVRACSQAAKIGVVDSMCVTMSPYASTIGKGLENLPDATHAGTTGEQSENSDSWQLAAEILGVSDTKLDMGQNLIAYGGFERWIRSESSWDPQPRGWRWTKQYGRDPFALAAIRGGIDGLFALEGMGSARIDGLWLRPDARKEKARAGFWYWDDRENGPEEIQIPPSSGYFFSFYYRTDRVTGGSATVWLAGVGESDDCWKGGNFGLPSSDGKWYRFVAIGWGSPVSGCQVSPLLRLYSTGSIWFDQAELRLLEVKDTSGVYEKTSHITVIRGDL